MRGVAGGSDTVKVLKTQASGLCEALVSAEKLRLGLTAVSCTWLMSLVIPAAALSR